jgi:hypothetical protein
MKSIKDKMILFRRTYVYSNIDLIFSYKDMRIMDKIYWNTISVIDRSFIRRSIKTNEKH